MQMLRFLRRVFIILILLIIVFFIFRFIKPEATSRFVDKVKNIPTTISSRFHREKKSNIIINWDTTYTNSNFEINDNDNDDENENYEEIYIPTIVDEETNETDTNEIDDIDDGEIKDFSWLDILNKELDKIIASSGQIESITGDQWNQVNDVEITEVTWSTLPSWFVVIDVEQPYTWTNQTNTQSTTTTSTNTNTTNNTQTTSNTQNSNTTANTTTTQQQCWACSANGECVSVQDCEDLIRDLWSLN